MSFSNNLRVCSLLPQYRAFLYLGSFRKKHVFTLDLRTDRNVRIPAEKQCFRVWDETVV